MCQKTVVANYDKNQMFFLIYAVYTWNLNITLGYKSKHFSREILIFFSLQISGGQNT